ncbi:cytochrome d ubiquinol oxidase subunit II [Paremcibacter congregatus]|uniref:Cytochrome d ubiquinol oxidase subunit II n=1 Tax=Paremcibacter congregatus TaxID=2043170 RepID=A0A2G4YW96_9PROT|nr:cytochrome d ubiquinol oxidase subunit II [Paremcibacter congregatus]PHZ86608.1 cytochrome d ubiquinol oxidase subunit II [Paremcibacter congregatus]QDE26410.1 cytochrome d ubiquinol oxidase subunit II [Paremcibacter congregatus]
MIDLPLIWAFLLAAAILIYVILDGFDLGIGILFPFLPAGENRDTAMNSIAPVWDGNETWLVLGGGGLFAAFPLAYALLMPALYAPLLAMLLGLVFRGVAFEFRWRDDAHRPYWDFSFTMGSLIAALCQGIALGAFIQGIDVDGRTYAGGWWDWLTPFSVMTGVALVVGYALLGATWLVMKTEGGLRDIARRFARRCAIGTVAFIILISGATLWLVPRFVDIWFSWPTLIYVTPVPIAVVLGTWWLWHSLNHGPDHSAFLAAILLFILSFIGLGISLFPYIVPLEITIWQAAAPEESQSFLLVGTMVLLPLILGYTAYAYWVFRGKVKTGEGYH